MTEWKIYDYGLEPAFKSKSSPQGTDLPPRQEVELCKLWMQKYAYKPKRRDKRYAQYSYGLKHKIEKVVQDLYVSNGACIQAALELGYEIFRDDPRDINACIHMRLQLPKDYPTRTGSKKIEIFLD